MLDIYKNQRRGNLIVKYISGCGPNGVGVVSFYGCNFKCPFCFAQRYSYASDKFPINKKGKLNDITVTGFSNFILDFLFHHPNLCYIQITGGEPLLNELRIQETIEALTILDRRVTKQVRVIYQTNGYFVGKMGILPDYFNKLKLLKNIKVLFEISIKGTNDYEFNILSGTGDPKGFYFQLNSYWLLKVLSSDNINVVARLGIGHHRSTIHFVDPLTRESLFQKNKWDSKFKEVFDDTTRRYGQSKMAAECINAEGDGSINNYIHTAIPGIARCLQSRYISARRESKAIQRATNRYDISYDSTFLTKGNWDKDYQEFLECFEPMGKNPASIYCGRNEFKRDHRQNCISSCVI